MNGDGQSSSYIPATWEKIVTYAVAVATIGLVIFLAVRNAPFKDPNIVILVRIILSLAIAILGATIPGFLNVGFTQWGFTIRAGGALALFVITFFGSPRVLPSLRDPSVVLLGPQQYPPESIIDEWPSSAELTKKPDVAPSDVTFNYKNASGQSLKLFVYRFPGQSSEPTDPFGTPINWEAWPFPADDSYHQFDGFSNKTNGWYGFAVGYFAPDGQNIIPQYLATKNIFGSKQPALRVTKSEDGRFQHKFLERGDIE